MLQIRGARLPHTNGAEPKSQMSRKNLTFVSMKSSMTILMASLFVSVCSLAAHSQGSLPSGKVKLLEFSNSTASFSVPAGKTWLIYNVFSDYCTKIEVKKNGDQDASCIRIFIKSLNDVQKTDLVTKKYGTQLYMSGDTEKAIALPLLFPEKTKFELLLIAGDTFKDFKLFDGNGYITVIENDAMN
jgi:hypothetical protein